MEDKVKILGICLGMQLLSEYSEEGNIDGLGWIKGRTVKFNIDEKLRLKYKIPHMGWNTISLKKSSILFNNPEPEEMYYFVHSYHLQCEDKESILGTTNYGCEFVSCVGRDNIYGTQFHPEKSHDSGNKLLTNFIKG